MEGTGIQHIVILLLVAVGVEAGSNTGIPGCRTTKLDLVFVVDGTTAAFQDEYMHVRSWIKNITSNFDVSPYTTRIAVVQNGEDPYTEFGFDVFNSNEGVVVAANNIQFGKGYSTASETLRYIKDNVLNTAREEASKVVLFLSDGTVRRRNDAAEAAKVLHDMGITMFAIGAGENMRRMRNVAYLKSITSDSTKKHLFLVRDLTGIGELETKIMEALCRHTVQECPTASHDLAFIIDGSSTIGHKNFFKIKEWMKKIINAFDTGEDGNRIAVIQYSTTVREEIGFNENFTKTEILSKVDDMELMTGDTHTGFALEYTLNVIFGANSGSRKHIPDVAIVMTDGKAQNREHVVSASKMIHDAGIDVYAIGVADYSLEELKVIASDPDESHVITATGFEQINLQRIGLIKRICEESEPGCPTTSADIVFLVDSSVTYPSEHLEHVKAWLKNMVDSFEVGPHYSKIGLVRYSSYPEVVFGLSSYTSTSEVLNAISSKLTYTTGYPETGRAIEYVTNVVFGEARPNTPKFLIVVTEGNSRDDITAAVERAKSSGIEIFAFGVREVNLASLSKIATQSDHVFHDVTFEGLRRKHGQFLTLMCQKSEPVCSIQEIDLQFLVDGSSSIEEENFEKVKDWIRTVIRSFDIGNYTTRVGLAQYASRVQNEFDLNTYFTQREIDHAVQKMKYMKGTTHTGEALNYTLDHSFTTRSGSRDGVAKVLVIISDGNSHDEIERAARRIQEAGISVYAVGAGETKLNALEMMATEPIVSHVTDSASYDGINTVRKKLVVEICKETKPECPEAEMDLIFLVDGSTSIGAENFRIVKDWLISFVNRFEIGEYNSKIGVIQYSYTPRLEINLESYLDKQTLTDAISKIEYINGGTNTAAALTYAQKLGFSYDGGARLTAPKVIIVLTDGESQDDVETPARILQDQGVIMYAVGVGDTEMSQLTTMASSEDNVLHVKDYDSIKLIQSSLVRRVCQKVETTCRENATDIVMLIDGSNSVGYKDWEIVKSFMRNITERFNIGPNGVQVGVVQYSSQPKTEFTLKDFTDISSLQNAINNLEWMMGDTHTAQALRYVQNRVLTKEAGVRGSNVSKILIVVTDGDPQDSEEVIQAARSIRSDGWRLFAIGVGQATLPELSVIASEPHYDHVFHANDFESTRKLKGRLFRMICTEYEVVPEVHETTLPPKTTTDEFDIAGDGKITLELKEPIVIDIHRHNFSGIVTFPNDVDGDIDVKNDKTTVIPQLGPANLIAPRSPIPVKPKLCPPKGKNGKSSGWDVLKELGISSHPGSPLKPKRSATLNRQSDSLERLLSARIKPGSNSSYTSYRLTSKHTIFGPLREIEELMSGSFKLVIIFRIHGATTKLDWTLMNVTDSLGAEVFSISFKGNETSVHLSLLTSAGLQSFEIDSAPVRQLFDREFHKLEIVAVPKKVLVKIDCAKVEAIREERVVLPLIGPLTGLLVRPMSDDENDQLQVDVQEIKMKCEPGDEETCCEVLGKPCGNTPIQPKVNSLQQCTCPPGPAGPPGRTGKRGPRGKMAPRYYNLKSMFSRGSVKAIASKVASTIIRDELRKMFQMLLDNINDEGKIDQLAIQTYVDEYDIELPTMTTRKYGKERLTGIFDCDGKDCDTIPADILDTVIPELFR